jgi:cobalt-zinc-cadmium efflux system outer membrane protein
MRERLPVPSLSAGAQLTNQVNGTSLVIGFSQPLTLFDRNQGAIAKAEAQVRQADLSIAAQLDETRAQIESRAGVLGKRRAALDVLNRDVMQQLPALRRMAEDAYREGSADILELLDANRSLRDLQIARVQQLESVKLAEEDVIAAAGLEAPTP